MELICGMPKIIIDYSTGGVILQIPVFPESRANAESLINENYDKTKIKVEKYRKARSKDANSYFWVLLGKLSEKMGIDSVEFLVATNLGEPLMPMTKIASGGELSRIMLALRSVLNDRDEAATVIFDEVDTGVSGKTSRKIGIKLSESAKNVQVLCVTHSAQIASLADVHYLISKREANGRAETEVAELSIDARIEEIARILGGIEITDAQRRAALEMIEEYKEKA